MKKVLGVITARGGSKGVPRKNVRDLLGKPLIAYTIEAAQASGVFDRLILSTDDDEIATVAKKYGCEVPFMRPAEFATDTASHLGVMQHAVSWLRDNEGYKPDYAMILQPTSPVRQAFHIKEAVGLIQSTGADSVLSVIPVPHDSNSYRAMQKDDEGFLKLMNGDPIYKRIARRQDLPETYFSVGLIYLFKTELLFDSAQPNFYGEKTAPYVVEERYAVNIDEPEDWARAEETLKALS